MTTTTAAPAARYLELRTAYHRDGDYAAADASHAIADAAYGTADQFDEVALDEQAREAVAGRPLSTR